MNEIESLNRRRIIEIYKRPSFSSFKNSTDLNEEYFDCEKGKPSEEQIIPLLKTLINTDDETAVIWPSSFFYNVSESILRKNILPLKVRTIKTLKKALENKIDVPLLIKEKISEMRREYNLGKDVLRKDYAGIMFRGITDRNFKWYYLIDDVLAYATAFDMVKRKNNPIKTKGEKYYHLKELLETPGLSIKERSQIMRIAKKINPKKERMLPEKAKEKIIRYQSECPINVPSTTDISKDYNVKFLHLPLSYSLEDDRFFGFSFDLSLDACTCEDQRWWIKYIKTYKIKRRITYIDKHPIIGFFSLFFSDRAKLRTNGYPKDPIFIATLSPFFKPTKEFKELCRKLYKQSFRRNSSGKIKHIPKTYVDNYAIKAAVSGLVSIVDYVNPTDIRNFKLERYKI